MKYLEKPRSNASCLLMISILPCNAVYLSTLYGKASRLCQTLPKYRQHALGHHAVGFCHSQDAHGVRLIVKDLADATDSIDILARYGLE